MRVYSPWYQRMPMLQVHAARVCAACRLNGQQRDSGCTWHAVDAGVCVCVCVSTRRCEVLIVHHSISRRYILLLGRRTRDTDTCACALTRIMPCDVAGWVGYRARRRRWHPKGRHWTRVPDLDQRAQQSEDVCSGVRGTLAFCKHSTL